MIYDVVASIVAFKNDKNVLKKAVDSFLSVDLERYLYVIDNSPTDELRGICTRGNLEYIFTGHNVGFGAGHNIAVKKTIERSKYFLILNPDIYFNEGTVEELFGFMQNNRDVGLVMPKVLYPDGSLQYLCRLLPSPYDMILRRMDIKIFNHLFSAQKSRYELKFADYNKPMDVPYLSGCFMFIRTDLFEKVGLFDERFFIYFEDIDLSRRIHRAWRTVYYPEAVVYHGYEKLSSKNMKILRYHISSGVKYFNKWGWFKDGERAFINDKALNGLLQNDGDKR